MKKTHHYLFLSRIKHITYLSVKRANVCPEMNSIFFHGAPVGFRSYRNRFNTIIFRLTKKLNGTRLSGVTPTGRKDNCQEVDRTKGLWSAREACEEGATDIAIKPSLLSHPINLIQVDIYSYRIWERQLYSSRFFYDDL